MNLDSDLKEKLREAKMNMEMEKTRLERQSEYEKIVNEINSTPTRSMDSMSLSDINLVLVYYSKSKIQRLYCQFSCSLNFNLQKKFVSKFLT